MKRVLVIAFLLVVATAFNVLVVGQGSGGPPAVVITVDESWEGLREFNLDPFLLRVEGSGSCQGQIVITPVRDEDILPHGCKENIRLTFSQVVGCVSVNDASFGEIFLFYTTEKGPVSGRLELHLGATPGVYEVQCGDQIIMIPGGYVLTLKTDNPVFIFLLGYPVGYPVTHFHMANGRVLIAH